MKRFRKSLDLRTSSGHLTENFFFFIFDHPYPIMVSQLVENSLAMQETPIRFLGWGGPLEKVRIHTQVFLGFPGGSAGKESTCNAEYLDSIPGLRRSPGERNGYPFQYSGLDNSMDCRVAKSRTRLSNFCFTSLP